MKILYVASEHTSGTLDIFLREHEKRGNYARLVTMFENYNKFYEDIQMGLWWVPTSPSARKFRKLVYRFLRGKEGLYKTAGGYPPVMHSLSVPEKIFHKIRELSWTPRINKVISENGLCDFDVYHFETGMDFFRNAKFAREVKNRGAKIICSYHGSDMRTRGVQPELDVLADANVTCELDLMEMHPDIDYVFLPFEYKKFSVREKENEKLRICHTTRDRFFKGSDIIIKTASKAAEDFGAEFLLLEDLPHEEVIKGKYSCDIAIDQISDTGGWGYGINSLETLAMGIPTCTLMNQKYEEFIPDHPFINVNPENLYEKIGDVIKDKTLRDEKKVSGIRFLEKYHSPENVMDSIYAIYGRLGLL
ncbi:MAG: glycosyltransferase [Fibrobacterota bacterium]